MEAVIVWARCFALAFLCAAGSPEAREVFVEHHRVKAPLRGTMLLAGTHRAPVALIIPGSGPTDRDGNSPGAIKAGTYRLLAERLAQRGITAVRIDKRGMFGSAAAVMDANDVVMGDYASDIRAWISKLRSQTGVSCVWLLGHSEGGLVALLTAQNPRDICGLVLLATPGRPAREIIREQLRAAPGGAQLLGSADSIIRDLEAGKIVKGADIPTALMPLFHPAVQGFLISQFRLDPSQLIKDVRKPVLIIQGLADIQVSEEDARELKRANPSAELLLIPRVTHVLKTARESSREANVATYLDPDLPISDEAVEPAITFILGR